MGNSVQVLDAAGEYVVNESNGEVYLWPYTTGDINAVPSGSAVDIGPYEYQQ